MNRGAPTSSSREPRRRVWPTRLAVAEGLADARTGRWVSVLLVLAVAWVAGGVGLANALEVSRLVVAEREWIAAGAHTVVVEPGPGTDTVIDAATCDRLTTVAGITASFAVLRTSDAATPDGAPGNRATIAHVTPGIFGILAVRAPADAAVLAAPATLAPLGLAEGDLTTLGVAVFDGTGGTERGTVRVVVADSPVLGADLTGAWILPDLLEGEASSCYVTADAAHLDGVRRYLPEALASDDGTPATVRPRLADPQHGLDFSSVHAARPLGWAWAAGGVFLTALWAVVRWTRRSRLAVYATFGAHRQALLTLQLTEWVSLSSVGAVWGWATSLAIALGLDANARAALMQVTGHVVATWAAATLGVLVGGLLPVGTLLDALKDRS